MSDGLSGIALDESPATKRLREHWWALGMMSYHGTASGVWFADLTKDDVEKLRALLHTAAAEIESARAKSGAVAESRSRAGRSGDDGVASVRPLTSAQREDDSAEWRFVTRPRRASRIEPEEV